MVCLRLCRMKVTFGLCVAGVRANFVYNLFKHVEDAYAFHDPCLNDEDAPLFLYA